MDACTQDSGLVDGRVRRGLQGELQRGGGGHGGWHGGWHGGGRSNGAYAGGRGIAVRPGLCIAVLSCAVVVLGWAGLGGGGSLLCGELSIDV